MATLVAQARGEYQARQQVEVGIGSTAYKEVLCRGVSALQQYQRVPQVGGIAEDGYTVNIAVGIGGHLLTGINQVLHALGNVVGIVHWRTSRIGYQ